MRIVMVLLIALLFAAAGGSVGNLMVDDSSVEMRSAHVPGQPRDRDREMMEAQRVFSAGAEVARQRARNIPIGAGVGLVVGLGAGAFVASRMAARSRRTS